MNETPANTAREDSPASGPSPEVQVPGKIVTEQRPPRLCGNASAPVRVTFSGAHGDGMGTPSPESTECLTGRSGDSVNAPRVAVADKREPIPADDEQPETAA